MAVLKTLITVRAEKEEFGRKIKKDGIFDVKKHFFVSDAPKMYALVLHDSDDLLDFIRNTGIFVVNFIEEERPIELIEAEKIFCKKIEHARHLECEVVNEVEAGDSWIVVGHVVG